MSQNSYQAYPAYEPGPAYFNGSINAPARAFDPRAQAPQPGVKQMEPGMQAILDGAHDARHSISRPFDSYTFPGYEASFHTTSSSLDQGLQALLNGHRPYASREPSVSYANPIANFYNDADGPWNSLRATSQARSSTSNATLTVPNKDKIWPRLDNFKQHVQRMHQDENMEDMIQRRNSIMEDPQKRILGPISNLIASSINQGAANESLDKAVLRALLELEKNKNIITPANHRRNLSLKEDRSSKNAERPPPGFGGPDGTETTISTAEVLQGLAALSKRIRQSARKPNPIVNSSKHRKRHTRPYGCTFSKCFKKFGSKNDWKRHEGSQHFQVETWRCEHQVSHEAPKCAEIFYESKVFEKHLRDSHRIADQTHIDTELRTRRIGRNGQSRFWCGFCQRIIELKTRFVEAWEERFNHIDEHFKLKRPITEWLDIEANKPKGEVEARMDRIDFDDEDPQPASLNASSEGSEGDPNSPSETGPTGASLRGTAERVDADVMILSLPRKGRKRTREEAEGEEDEPVDGEPRRKSRKVAISSLTRMLPQCDCKQGPFAWSLYQSCLYCDHEFCERCDRRKHESSTEESVDYNLWSHVVSR
ncbi:putative c2h2 type zinc finger domain protein [Neofusicoccum parvum UCRNP2]|uniref:Putative c2h2 type zinc finger domain protein n=1 Tax=Botryosphaeria parva (strain UCR-NP2) TaxID=1287680 RepID=R1GSL7_BOTPV|nr:putative c2h2 type zinc finger domain protein [Neofusicoccum parvum UCRNP2]